LTERQTGDDGVSHDGAGKTELRFQAPRLSPGARRIMRGAGGLGLGALAAISVIIGGFLILLSRGPIGFDWLTPTIVNSLNDLFARRYEFGLAGVAVANTDHGPTLTVQGLTVKSGGRMIVAAPRAELSVDLASLLVGKIKPRRLEMLDLELRLAVSSDGGVAISAGTAPQVSLPIEAPPPAAVSSATAGLPPEGAKILARAGGALRALSDLATSPDSVIGAIDRVGLAHGRLVIDDQTVGRVIAYNDLSLSLDRSVGGMKFSLAATGAARRWSVVATAKGVPGARRSFDAEARDFSLDDIALFGGMRKLPFDTDSPLSAELHFALGLGDRVVEASGMGRLGAGFFRLDEPDFEPVMVRELSGAAHWDKVNRQFVLSPIEIKTGSYDMALEGEVSPPVADSDALQAGASSPADLWICSLRLAKPTWVGPDRAGQHPLRLDRSSLRLRLSLAGQNLRIDNFELAAPDVNATGSALITWASGAHVVYGLNFDNTQIAAVVRLLPTHSAAPARYWFMEHVPAGVIKRGEINADFNQSDIVAMRYEQPPPDSGIHGEADIVNAAITEIVPGVPPFSNLSAHLRLTGRTLSLEGASGVLETPHGHRINITEGRFFIPDNAPKPAPALLEMRFAGNVDAVADILAIPSIAPYAALPVDPAQLKGQVDGRLRADLEVGDGARPDHTVVAVDANATNLSIDRFLGAERLENGALNIQQDRASGLRVTGTGRLLGGAATLDIKRAPTEGAAMQAQLSVVLDEAARAKAGFALPGVVGPITAQVKTTLPLNEAETPVELDLTRASLDNILPGVVKPAGKAAKAQFTMLRRPEGITLERFSLDASPTQLAGSVELSKEGVFRSAKFSQFRLSPGDDARLEAQRGADALKLSVRATNLDARPMLRSLTASGEKPGQSGGKGAISFDDLDLDLKSPIVTGFGKQILSNVDFRWERRNGKPRVFSLQGNFGREPLAVALSRNESGAQMEISSADGGALMSFLDLYGRMDSGVLTARIQIGQGRSDGVLHVRDFYLKNEPAMRQLMAQGASRSDEKGGYRFDPESVRVARLQAEFGWAAGKLSLRDGIMSGPEMGLTFDGYVDLARETVDLGGSYVPAYGLNNLVSNIPVFGQLLTGGAHEGIFALNYRVTGQLGAPAVRVNPLSALTPGLFRKIMGVMDETARPREPGR
jgi:hypothetical protein